MTFGIPRMVAWLFILSVVNLAAVDPWALASAGGLAQMDGEPAGEPAGAPAGEVDAPDSLASPRDPGQEAVTAPSEPFDHLILTDRGPAIGSDTPASKGAPVYKRWWFWTVAASAVAAVVVLSATRAEEPRKDLPDFPNPPDR